MSNYAVKERVSDSYICTVGNDSQGMETVRSIRRQVSRLNKKYKNMGQTPSRVVLRGRGGGQDRYGNLPVNMAKRFDVYIYDRNTWR